MGPVTSEQARGHDVDRRADIWAFGVIVHELLTGKRLFDAPTVSDTLAAVLTREPDLSAAPLRFHRLLRLCLKRDPRERLSHISAARYLLEEPEPPAVAAAPRRLWPAWTVAGIALAVAAGLGVMAWRATGPRAARPMIQLDLDTGQEVLQPAISPDGMRVAFVSRDAKGSRLATRRLDQTAATALPETEGASRPFFSPDGRSLGFFAGGKLKKVSLDGGAPVVLADAEYPGGGMWGDDGTIAAVLGQWTTRIVFRIPSAGGSPQPWTARDPNGEGQIAPYLLPGGKGMAFTSRGWKAGYRYSLRIAASGKPDSVELLQDASGARHLDGHLLFYRQGKLFAAPFDATALKVTGEAIPMVEEVAEAEGVPQFDVASSGDLVYRRGREAGRVVVRMDPSGKVDRITPAPGGYVTPRFSPDGKRLAVVDISGAQPRILIYDLARGVATRLTLDDRAQSVPAWTPDGRYVVYQSTETMLAVRADGAGQPEPVLTTEERTTLSFSRDGKWAVGSRHNTQTNRSEIWIAPVDRAAGSLRFGKAVTVASSPGVQDEPVFSPDGRFLAYMSNESGTYQIYVASLTPDGRAAGGKWQVSHPTGYNPVWPAAGGQLFYDEGSSGQIHVVSYAANGDSFAAAPPRPWSPHPVSHYIAKMYDVTDDGKQMIAILEDDSAPPETRLHLILNFGDELRRRLAGAAK